MVEGKPAAAKEMLKVTLLAPEFRSGVSEMDAWLIVAVSARIVSWW